MDMIISSIKKFYINLGILVVIFCIGVAFTPFYVKVTNSSSNSNIQDTLSITQSAGNKLIIEDWPTLHGNFNRTGATETTPKEGNTTIWSFKTGDRVMSSPTISNGFVYVGSNDNNLLCIDATNGDLIWYFTTKGDIQSSPTIANGLVYFGGDDNNCYCLNATTGTLLWNYTTCNAIFNSVALANGRVYFSSFDDYFYCLNGTTGILLWKLNVGKDSPSSQVCSSPVITKDSIYIGGLNKHLYCLNVTQGEIIWDRTLDYPIYSTPVIENGLLYVGNVNLYCLNATIGATNWINSYSTPGFLISIPAVANGYVYAGTYDGVFYCFNANNGKMMWKYPLGASRYTLSFEFFKLPSGTSSYPLFSSPAVANGMVYIGSPNGNVYCLNANKGKLMWNYTTSYFIDSSPAIYNGAVYIGGFDGNLYCLPMIMPYTSEPYHSAFLLFGIPLSFGIIYVVVILFSIIVIAIILKRIYSKKHKKKRRMI